MEVCHDYQGVNYMLGSFNLFQVTRVAEPCHFSAAPAPEPSIFFTVPAPEPEPAPAPTYIASHQFLKINAYGTVPCFFTKLLHAWVTWGPFRPKVIVF